MTVRIAVALAFASLLAGCATTVDPNRREVLEFKKPGVTFEAMKKDSAKCWAYANSLKMNVSGTGPVEGALKHGAVGVVGSALEGPIAADAHKPYSVYRVRHHNICMLDKGYSLGTY